MYRISDNGEPDPVLTDTATLTITVAAVNDAPRLNPDTATTVNPANGAVTYTPGRDFFGTDTFTYRVADNGSPTPTLTSTETVPVTVNPVNDAPDAVGDVGETEEDTPVTIDVLANDSDVDGNLLPATVVVTQRPQNGRTSVDPATGAITYTPNSDYNGGDAFTYRVTDDGFPLPVLSSEATVLITVGAVNDDIPAGDDTAATVDGAAVGPYLATFRVSAAARTGAAVTPVAEAAYTIAPDALYTSPVTIELPMPEEGAPHGVVLRYRFGQGADARWVDARAIDGFLASALSAVREGGRTYVRFQVNHGAAVALVPAPGPSQAASPAPLQPGANLLLWGVVIAVLAAAARRRQSGEAPRRD